MERGALSQGSPDGFHASEADDGIHDMGFVANANSAWGMMAPSSPRFARRAEKPGGSGLRPPVLLEGAAIRAAEAPVCPTQKVAPNGPPDCSIGKRSGNRS